MQDSDFFFKAIKFVIETARKFRLWIVLIYFFSAVLGLRCCTWLSLVAEN